MACRFTLGSFSFMLLMGHIYTPNYAANGFLFFPSYYMRQQYQPEWAGQQGGYLQQPLGPGRVVATGYWPRPNSEVDNCIKLLNGLDSTQSGKRFLNKQQPKAQSRRSKGSEVDKLQKPLKDEDDVERSSEGLDKNPARLEDNNKVYYPPIAWYSDDDKNGKYPPERPNNQNPQENWNNVDFVRNEWVKALQPSVSCRIPLVDALDTLLRYSPEDIPMSLIREYRNNFSKFARLAAQKNSVLTKPGERSPWDVVGY